MLLALTVGEPAGVGPELCTQIDSTALLAHHQAQAVVLGDLSLIAARAQLIGHPISLVAWQPGMPLPNPPHLAVWHHPINDEVIIGQPHAKHAKHVLTLLDAACDGCLSGLFNAMITAPIQKSTINDCGIVFSGHTEYLDERCHSSKRSDPTQSVTMMLVGGGMRVALATTHIPLKTVADHIKTASLLTTLRTLHHALTHQFGIPSPRIAVCGLNPHAGESGHLGTEEITEIIPALQIAQSEGINVQGPFPADTLFVPHHLEHTDAVLAMYHDQGLATLKYASFGQGVNVTLGLPIIRTSVDHGTALDLAGTGRANPGSLLAAVALAAQLAQHHRART